MELLLFIVGHLLLLSITYTNADNINCASIVTDPKAPSDPDRDKMLKVFNDLRESITTGSDPNLKKAKNMYKLFWDCNMEKKLINAINPAKGKMTLTKKYAQNYEVIAKSAATDAEGYTKIVKDKWYQEGMTVGLDKNQTYKDRLDNFANMLNAKATYVACAYKDDTTATPPQVHYSCIWNVKPVKGESIYERGTPCTKHKQCTTYIGSNCDATAKLCEYRGDIPGSDVTTAPDVPTPAPDVPTPAPGVPTPAPGVPTPAPGVITPNTGACSAYMTAEARTKVVDAHNYRRTLLATGQIRNGKNPDNANLGKAANMARMYYDMSLEAQAIAYAQQCKMVKSAESERPGFGENIYVHPTVMKDPVELILQAVVNWWTQIFQDGINWQVIFKQSLRDKYKEKGIDQTAFTQMAWAKTNRVGCAIAEFSGKSFVVCRYSPAGNILDQPIYEIGYECGSCPGTCNPAEGLCN